MNPSRTIGVKYVFNIRQHFINKSFINTTYRNVGFKSKWGEELEQKTFFCGTFK